MSLTANRQDAAPIAAAFDFSALRPLLFVAVLALAWISLDPFPDLGSSSTLEITTGNDGLTYALFGLFAVLSLALIARDDWKALKSLFTAAYVALAVWIGVSVISSQDVGTSLKRAVLLGFVATVAACLFHMPKGRRDLALLLSIAALVLLGLSYFGVIFLPGRSIHQVTDLLEPQLAGDWRGVFGHKNDASAVFSLITFVGLFAMRSSRPIVGALVFALAFFFLLMTVGKSSTALCIMVIGVTLIAQKIRSPWLWSLVVLTPLIILNAIGVGAVISPTLAGIAHLLPLDTSFTGRTEIWQYALDKIDERRWLGHGFFAFWNTDAVRYGNGDDTTVWAGNAAHAHNGYLDAALAMGYPGLVVTLLALVAQPARDLRAAVVAGADPALTLMLFQIWLFGLYLSSLESFFYDRSNAIWVTFLFAIFGLRYLAKFRSKP